MNPQKEFDELWDLKLKIQSEVFQNRVMKPLYEKLDGLKPAYECKTLTELATLKGKKQGLSELIDIFQQLEVDLKNAKTELESQQE